MFSVNLPWVCVLVCSFKDNAVGVRSVHIRSLEFEDFAKSFELKALRTLDSDLVRARLSKLYISFDRITASYT